MARDPSKTVDFAPAWLNFNNSNKKKTERSSGTLTVNNVPPKSHERLYKCSSGNKDSVSPSRSGNFWGQQSPTSRINSRHQSSNFVDYSSKKDVSHVSPGRDTKSAHSKSNVFSNTCSHISKKDGSYHNMYANNWNSCLQYKNSDDKSPRLDTDFPSLSDMDISDNTRGRSSQASATVTNMWSKPLRLKATSNQNSNESSFTKSQVTASIYKNLVPKSSSSNQKQPYRRTMSVPLNLPSKSPLNASGEMIVPSTKRDLGDSPRLQQQKLLDAQRCGSRPMKLERAGSGKKYTSGIGVVSGHKKHRKGKTEFLNTLRQEEGDSAGRVTPSAKVSDKDLPEQECPSTQSLFDNENINDGIPSCLEERRKWGSENKGKMELGQEDNEVNRRIKSWNSSFDPLSSSLEAEHRLLREMGWQYTDDQEIEEEPLTEDEIRDFFLQNKQNGLLTVPTANRREEAFNSAISEWKFSGIRRQHNQNGSSKNFNAILSTGDNDISSSDEL